MQVKVRMLRTSDKLAVSRLGVTWTKRLSLSQARRNGEITVLE